MEARDTITIAPSALMVDLYVVLRTGVSMREASRQIRREVACAMHEIVGLNVASIDVHIADVGFASSSEPA